MLANLVAVPPSAVTRQLRRRLGGIVRTDRQARWEASFDSSKLSYLPAAVIRPRKAADVGVVLALANRHRVPVTVRGRGTTLTGGAVPLRGGWVIDLTGLRRIRIDAEAGMARAKPVGSLARHHRPTAGFIRPIPRPRNTAPSGATLRATPAACTAGGMA